MALSQILCLDDNNVNLRTNESKPEFFYSEDQRLALEALIHDGRDAFKSYIQGHNVREFLSELELERLACIAEEYDPGTDHERGKGHVIIEDDAASLQYWPDRSDYSVPSLDLGWPDCASFRGVTRVNVYTQPPTDGQAHIKEVIRKTIAQAQKVIAVVMDLFTDVDIFIDLLDAAFKRKVAVYIILDAAGVPHFLSMCRRTAMHRGHLKNLRVRSTRGTEFYTRSARKVFGSLGQKFMFVDGDRAVSGSYSYTWTASRLDRNLVTVLTGQAVETIDKQFQYLYLTSEAVNLTEINLVDEPEPELVPAPAPAPVPSAAVARRLINPKYALVSSAIVEGDGKSSSEKDRGSKIPVPKVLKPPRETQEALPVHPGLLNLERVSMIPYLPTWPEPDPPSDVIGFINIRDSSKPMQVHLMRSELFETSQAIRFKEPFVPAEDPLPQKACPKLKPIKNTKDKKHTEPKHHDTKNEQCSTGKPLDLIGPPVAPDQEQTQSQHQEMLDEPGNKIHTTDQTHPPVSQDKEHPQPQHHGTLQDPGKITQPRDQTQLPSNQDKEHTQPQQQEVLHDPCNVTQPSDPIQPPLNQQQEYNESQQQEIMAEKCKSQATEETYPPVNKDKEHTQPQHQETLPDPGSDTQPRDQTCPTGNQNQGHAYSQHCNILNEDGRTTQHMQPTEKTLSLVLRDAENRKHKEKETVDEEGGKAQLTEKTCHQVPQELPQKETKDQETLNGPGNKAQPTDHTYSSFNQDQEHVQAQHQEPMLESGSNTQPEAQTRQGTPDEPGSEAQPKIQAHLSGSQNLDKECRDQGISTKGKVQDLDQRDSPVSLKSGTVDEQREKGQSLDQTLHILKKTEVTSSPVPKPRTVHLVFDSSSGKDISMVKHIKVEPSHDHTLDYSIKHTQNSEVHDNESLSTKQTDKKSKGDKTCLHTDNQNDGHMLMTEEEHSASVCHRKDSDVSTASEEYYECVDYDSFKLQPEPLANGIHTWSTPLENHGDLGTLETGEIVPQSVPAPQAEIEQQGDRQIGLENILEVESKYKLTAQPYGNDSKQHQTSLHSQPRTTWLVQEHQEKVCTKPGTNGTSRSYRSVEAAKRLRLGQGHVTYVVRASQGGPLSHHKDYRTSAVETSTRKGRSQPSFKRLPQAQRAKPKTAWLLGHYMPPRRHPLSQGDNLTPFGIPLASLSDFKHLKQKMPGSPLGVLKTTKS